MTLLPQREESGVSQADLARRMGVDHAAVHRLERRSFESVRPRNRLRYLQALADLVAEKHQERELLAAGLEATARQLRAENP